MKRLKEELGHYYLEVAEGEEVQEVIRRISPQLEVEVVPLKYTPTARLMKAEPPERQE